ncbi:hypothetical protein TSH64_12310 [Azospirillum sp. TSH64]|nr:hypothetical protein TSH64_12310 [Azospirillum sp. TSH64]
MTTTRSANSTMPFLMPCSSSPPAGSSSSMNRSTMSATAVSDWPTPTVSTTITSKPAASQTSIASRVRRATPPSVAPAGEGRMKAAGSRDRSTIRVLSPKIEPPVRCDDGSTASTATLCPSPMTCSPNASMKVDLPTPGTPEMPSRTELPVWGSSASSSASAVARWSARVDSISVIARASARRSPERTASARRAAACRAVSVMAAASVCAKGAVPYPREQSGIKPLAWWQVVPDAVVSVGGPSTDFTDLDTDFTDFF